MIFYIYMQHVHVPGLVFASKPNHTLIIDRAFAEVLENVSHFSDSYQRICFFFRCFPGLS